MILTKCMKRSKLSTQVLQERKDRLPHYEKLKAISPHYHVDKIKADVFIVHGGRDEQAHYDNALNIHEQFEKHNKPLKWMWKETEGHGFADPENRLDLMEAMV